MSKTSASYAESRRAPALRTGTHSTSVSAPRISFGTCAARFATPTSSKGNGMMYLIRIAAS